MKNLFEMSGGVEEMCVLLQKLRGEDTQVWVQRGFIHWLFDLFMNSSTFAPAINENNHTYANEVLVYVYLI